MYTHTRIIYIHVYLRHLVVFGGEYIGVAVAAAPGKRASRVDIIIMYNFSRAVGDRRAAPPITPPVAVSVRTRWRAAVLREVMARLPSRRVRAAPRRLSKFDSRFEPLLAPRDRQRRDELERAAIRFEPNESGTAATPRVNTRRGVSRPFASCRRRPVPARPVLGSCFSVRTYRRAAQRPRSVGTDPVRCYA